MYFLQVLLLLGFVKKGTVHEYIVDYPAPPADDWNPLLIIIVLLEVYIVHIAEELGKL